MFLSSDPGMHDTAGFTRFPLPTNLIEKNFGISSDDELIVKGNGSSAHYIMRFAFMPQDFYTRCPVFKRLSNY